MNWKLGGAGLAAAFAVVAARTDRRVGPGWLAAR
jgi:hypothetical protein